MLGAEWVVTAEVLRLGAERVVTPEVLRRQRHSTSLAL